MTATTPATTAELSKQYNPVETEAKWQHAWETNHVFKADPNGEGEPYCVVIPPPNVTGSLHMGHAFENALIDTLVRYHRMIGRNTLWLPGTDHASIAVQTILERQLKQEGSSRDQVGRSAFLERAWTWKEESGGTIVGQLRRLGVSVDWSRERFTMDEGLSKAVIEAFTRLYQEGMIYRGKYMVNWCPASQSAVSDLEVENKEVDGHLWHLRYPLSDGSGHIEVATTRPETMLGDTAVAVNPHDDRYRHFIGKTVTLPLMNRQIPIIGDEYVDSSFGTGCVKITPAHDPNDFEMGQRHNLPFITIMNKDGTLNENAGEFQGQDRFEARTNIVKRLEEDGFLAKVEDYRHTVPYSDRGKVPVEPLLSTQWFVKIRPMADRALDFLDNHQEPLFVPERWTKVYRDWLVSLRDWCISRQLWWGHQIPAWYAVSETHGEITDETPFVVVRTEEEAWQQARELFGPDVQLQQDPDVLDTWFSSGLWPFSTMGWPEQTPDLERYYPTTTLVTGFDIIFFWVARMTMMAGHFTGQMPFKTVYIHGLVRDENNKKMSKSANNGIDPLILIDKYGTDALRYTLIREVVGAGQDIRLEYNRKTDESTSVEASRNFTNKLWNASRFVMMNLDGQTPASLGAPDTGLELSDRWILSRYHQVVRHTRQSIDHYGLGEAAKELYEFVWGDFCDWYIELAKSRLQGQDSASRRVAQQTLAYVLDGILKLLHPFMPHITEELWHTLTQASEQEFLAVQPYPIPDDSFIQPELEEQFNLLFNTIRTVRNLRAEAGIKPGAQIEAFLVSDRAQEREILGAGQSYIQDLAKVKTLAIAEAEASIVPASDAVSVETGVALSDSHSELVVAEPAGALVPISSSSSGTAEHRAPMPLTEKYAQIAVTLGTLFLAGLSLKLVATILSELATIPLVSPTLRLIGFVMALRFIYRNLLYAGDRQNLSAWISDWLEERGWRTAPQTALPGVQEAALLPAATSVTPTLPAASSTPVDLSPESTELSKSKPQMFAGIVGTVQVLIPLAGMVDVDALKAKLTKDLGKAEAEAKSLSGRLSNPTFVEKAPADVVQGARDALAEADAQATLLRDRLSRL